MSRLVACLSHPSQPRHVGPQTVRPAGVVSTSMFPTAHRAPGLPIAPIRCEFQGSTPASIAYDDGGDIESMSPMTHELLGRELPGNLLLEGTSLPDCDSLTAQAQTQAQVERMDYASEQVLGLSDAAGANALLTTAEFCPSFAAPQGFESF